MAMNVTQRADLEILHSTFYGRAAQRGKATLLNLKAQHKDKAAFWLLRHHNEGDITDKETWERDEVDYLLSYYSMLYVGMTAGLINVPPTEPLLESASELLSYAPLIRYFSKNYPLELPARFGARLDTYGSLEAIGSAMYGQSTAAPQKRLFSAFVPLTAILEHDHDMEAFLWLLDGGWRNNWHYERLEKVLRNPNEAATLLMNRRADPVGHRIMQGTLKFIEFAVDLDVILTDASASPNLQEEMYLYHSYWFAASKHLTQKLIGLLDSLASVGGDVSDVRFHFASLANRSLTITPSPQGRKRTKDKSELQRSPRTS